MLTKEQIQQINQTVQHCFHRGALYLEVAQQVADLEGLPLEFLVLLWRAQAYFIPLSRWSIFALREHGFALYTPDTVWEFNAELLPMARPHPARQRCSESLNRKLKAIRLVLEGATYVQAAETLGMSKTRISTLVKKFARKIYGQRFRKQLTTPNYTSLLEMRRQQDFWLQELAKVEAGEYAISL